MQPSLLAKRNSKKAVKSIDDAYCPGGGDLPKDSSSPAETSTATTESELSQTDATVSENSDIETCTETEAIAESTESLPCYSLSRSGYTLEQVVVLSRHNIRAPMSSKGSLLDEVTPHDWFEWSSDASELSLRGGASETIMGQHSKKGWSRKGCLRITNSLPREKSGFTPTRSSSRSRPPIICCSIMSSPTPKRQHLDMICAWITGRRSARSRICTGMCSLRRRLSHRLHAARSHRKQDAHRLQACAVQMEGQQGR